ncbi:hypothetical protein M878_09835 [Streptomyces roseochromogenus subsp. oscitans DS 12.976]|uniref:DUF4349 domain-containing protein n=1 Tax=Streptomyces roseochromogenus subsp. oscitans DS 12.976 TaxID=1352936 RepID=V6KST9_STRRC|nr:hypothetical protein M878_09835 [Streptomyces roseochromogenus subsp. oscitans DS 12.976]
MAGILLAAGLALTGCGSADDSGGGSAKSAAHGAGVAAGPGKADSAEAGSGKPAPRSPRLPQNAIIRTASLTVEVKDVGKEDTSRDTGGHERTQVVLRVPGARYDSVLARLQGTGRLIDRTAEAEDVTGQVVDVSSRVTSQRASVDRIRALTDRAAQLSDVVMLEGELSSRQADLESLLAQQASLKDRTSLATITLSLSETPVRKAAGDDSPGIGDALAGGWHVFVTVLRWIALALGAALPFVAFAALLTLLWLRVVRPRLPRRREPAQGMTALGPLPSARPVPEPDAPEPGRD